MTDNDLIARLRDACRGGDGCKCSLSEAADRIKDLIAVTVLVPSNERAHLLHTLSEALDAAEVGEFQTVEIYVSDALRLFKVLDDLRLMDVNP